VEPTDLRCTVRGKVMSKDSLMERVALWTARFEDGSLLRETMEENEVDAFLLDEAYNIMCQLWEDAIHEN